MVKESDKLILIVKATFAGAIGYGEIFKCDVIKILGGNLEEKNITITILSGDKLHLSFMLSHLDSREFELRCNKLKDNEPYSLMPISGFVDKNKTSWKIVSLMDI